jgi:hypothetical protein
MDKWLLEHCSESKHVPVTTDCTKKAYGGLLSTAKPSNGPNSISLRWAAVTEIPLLFNMDFGVLTFYSTG